MQQKWLHHPIGMILFSALSQFRALFYHDGQSALYRGTTVCCWVFLFDPIPRTYFVNIPILHPQYFHYFKASKMEAPYSSENTDDATTKETSIISIFASLKPPQK